MANPARRRAALGASLWRLGLILLVGLASYARSTSAQVCPQLGISIKTTPRGKGGSAPSVRAGKHVNIRVFVRNEGPTDLSSNLVVGITLPDFLVPLQSKTRSSMNKPLATPVSKDGRDLYWVGLSLPAGKSRKYVLVLFGETGACGPGGEDRNADRPGDVMCTLILLLLRQVQCQGPHPALPGAQQDHRGHGPGLPHQRHLGRGVPGARHTRAHQGAAAQEGATPRQRHGLPAAGPGGPVGEVSGSGVEKRCSNREGPHTQAPIPTGTRTTRPASAARMPSLRRCVA